MGYGPDKSRQIWAIVRAKAPADNGQTRPVTSPPSAATDRAAHLPAELLPGASDLQPAWHHGITSALFQACPKRQNPSTSPVRMQRHAPYFSGVGSTAGRSRACCSPATGWWCHLRVSSLGTWPPGPITQRSGKPGVI